MSYHANLTEYSEYMEQYRRCVASLDVPAQEIDLLIEVVYAIMSNFVDQAFNVQTDQITLQSVGKGFKASPAGVTIEHHPENQTARAPSDGFESDSNLIGPSEP